MNNMKKILTILAICIFLFSCYPIDRGWHRYDVKITFCDTREPIILNITYHHKPSNIYINNDREAVPSFVVWPYPHTDRTEGVVYLNVCDVQIVKEYPIEYN